MFKDLAIWILRKSKCSVIIGCRVDGDVQFLNNVSLIYDNEFNGNVLLSNGQEFEVPQGKFNLSKSL